MLAYASPFCASAFLLAPTWFVLPGIYSKYYGLELTAVAFVVLCARVFDAVADPIIGILSNRHRVRGGSRKVWVVAGGISFAIAAYFLFIPSESVSLSYYLLFSLIFFAV